MIYQTEEGFKESDYNVNAHIYIENFEQQKLEVLLQVNDRTLFPEKGLILTSTEYQVAIPENTPKFYLGQNVSGVAALLMHHFNYDINKQERSFVFKNSSVNPESTDGEITMQYSRVINQLLVGPLFKNIIYKSVVGDKRYELSNHLGNVLSVISDRKLLNFESRGVPLLSINFDDNTAPTLLSSTISTVKNIANKKMQVSTLQRGDGVKTQIDLETDKVYQLAFDLEAQYKGLIEVALVGQDEKPVFREILNKTSHYSYVIKGITTGNYELTYRTVEEDEKGYFALDNLSVTDISMMRNFQPDDILLFAENAIFVPDVLSYNDYYPFGMYVPGRHESSGEYRYGFQGQEKDDEVKGEGNSINYTFRMHDPRVGRFFAVDPLTKKYPYYTPYSFSGNKVIHAIELEGGEEIIAVSDLSQELAVPHIKRVNEFDLSGWNKEKLAMYNSMVAHNLQDPKNWVCGYDKYFAYTKGKGELGQAQANLLPANGVLTAIYDKNNKISFAYSDVDMGLAPRPTTTKETLTTFGHYSKELVPDAGEINLQGSIPTPFSQSRITFGLSIVHADDGFGLFANVGHTGSYTESFNSNTKFLNIEFNANAFYNDKFGEELLKRNLAGWEFTETFTIPTKFGVNLGGNAIQMFGDEANVTGVGLNVSNLSAPSASSSKTFSIDLGKKFQEFINNKRK